MVFAMPPVVSIAYQVSTRSTPKLKYQNKSYNQELNEVRVSDLKYHVEGFAAWLAELPTGIRFDYRIIVIVEEYFASGCLGYKGPRWETDNFHDR